MSSDILQFFAFAHLPERLQVVSKPFAGLAHDVIAALPACPERTVALRKLLEAKDAAVRCLVYKPAAAAAGEGWEEIPAERWKRCTTCGLTRRLQDEGACPTCEETKGKGEGKP